MNNWVRAQLKRLHIGALIGLLLALYISYYLVATIRHNYTLQQQITGLQQQITGLQDEKDQLKYRIQYYQTDAYKEKEARAKLGLQAPGEGVVVLPHSDDTHTDQTPTKVQPKKSHLQQWVDFLRGRT
jgi:cell division protein FtsB